MGRRDRSLRDGTDADEEALEPERLERAEDLHVNVVDEVTASPHAHQPCRYRATTR